MTRKGRAVNGILVLDKPPGLTSNHALQRVKRLFGARKAGHTGSLDPLATGLLPVCFGEATKASGFLLDANKYYSVRARFGVRTDTGDAEGTVIGEVSDEPVDASQLAEVAARFVGNLEQMPPMYSALKQQGRRLYELAREGVTVERELRPITIHALGVTAVEGVEAVFEVHCTKGTYIRTLIADIGDEMGLGAHVSGLRRTGIGPFAGTEPVTMQALNEARDAGQSLDGYLLPMDSALADWPALSVTGDALRFIHQGQAVWIPRAPATSWVRLYGPAGGFIGMGAMLDDGRVAPKRLVSRRGRD